MRTDGPVVIALDGTLHSAGTLAWGMAEAVRRRSPVVLAQVVGNPWLTGSWGTYPVIDPQAIDDDSNARAYLRQQRRREQARHPGLEIRTQVLRGPVVSQLSRLSTDAQLVVVGAGTPSVRARSGVLGARLASHAHCPVAVVRTAHGATPPEAPIVVGVDGSPAAALAARVAAREAWMRGRGLVVVHARSAPPLEPATSDVVHRPREAATRLQCELRAENPGLDVRLEYVDDAPAHALVGVAQDAALLVVGTRGLGTVTRRLLGSVSSEVARSASCPVLVVRGAS